MTVSLNRSYSGMPAGSIVTLNPSTEAALIAQNLANASALQPTAGNVNSTEHNGRVTFAAGATSVTVTNAMVNPTSKVSARINQAVADTGLTGIRVVPAIGSFTIYGNAAAAAAVAVDWELASTGLTPNQ